MCSVLVEVALRKVMDRYVITPMKIALLNAENKTQSSDYSLALCLKNEIKETGRNMREKM